jgi:hypothetical protein
MSKRQKTGYQGEGVVSDLVKMKHETKTFSKYGKSVVPIGTNSEVYEGRTFRGNPTVVIRPRTSHFAKMNEPQRKLHEAVAKNHGYEGVRKYFADETKNPKVSITILKAGKKGGVKETVQAGKVKQSYREEEY